MGEQMVNFGEHMVNHGEQIDEALKAQIIEQMTVEELA
jgi:hypothetical protein